MACAPEALSPAPLATFADAGRVRNTAVSEEEVDTSMKVRGAQLCRATTLRARGEAYNSPRQQPQALPTRYLALKGLPPGKLPLRLLPLAPGAPRLWLALAWAAPNTLLFSRPRKWLGL